jgi:hypothetical protein
MPKSGYAWVSDKNCRQVAIYTTKLALLRKTAIRIANIPTKINTKHLSANIHISTEQIFLLAKLNAESR